MCRESIHDGPGLSTNWGSSAKRRRPDPSELIVNKLAWKTLVPQEGHPFDLTKTSFRRSGDQAGWVSTELPS